MLSLGNCCLRVDQGLAGRFGSFVNEKRTDGKAMALHSIDRISVLDARYPLPHGAGSDAVHTNPEYCCAVTRLVAGPIAGTGIALTLGEGNRLVCDAIELLVRSLKGKPIEELMAQFGKTLRALADDPALRWLGPHKGVVHLALASITNACFDLWAKSRGVPLRKLLLELSREQVASLLDLSYREDVLDESQALALLRDNMKSRKEREEVLQLGYPGYDTSVGWMAYDDDKVRGLIEHAIARGFNPFKLKVGSPDPVRDLRRAVLLR